MNASKRIAVLTGKRGGYGAMQPILSILRDSDDFELQLIVTDQHLNPDFGMTIHEVQQAFDVAAAVDMKQRDGSAKERAVALGNCTIGMSNALSRLNPDLLILYGDRGEVLATALVAAHLKIPIVHLQGGDVSGNIDESIRHALTKLSHLHFASTQDSAKRIIGLGEEAWRVHVVGDNHIDNIIAGNYTQENDVRAKFAIDFEDDFVIMLQHPETVHERSSYKDAKASLDAIAASGMRAIVVYPCSDAGYEGIIQAIEEYRNYPKFSIYKNIDAKDFWGLMSIARVFIGNSSAGLIETPAFHLPAINIGDRQEGRIQGGNVVNVRPDKDEIRTLLDKIHNDSEFRSKLINAENPYGDGTAAQKITDVIRNLDMTTTDLLNKRMTY